MRHTRPQEGSTPRGANDTEHNTANLEPKPIRSAKVRTFHLDFLLGHPKDLLSPRLINHGEADGKNGSQNHGNASVIKPHSPAQGSRGVALRERGFGV